MNFLIEMNQKTVAESYQLRKQSDSEENSRNLAGQINTDCDLQQLLSKKFMQSEIQQKAIFGPYQDKIGQHQFMSLLTQKNFHQKQIQCEENSIIYSQTVKVSQTDSKISQFLERLLQSSDQIEIPDLFEEFDFSVVLKVLSNILLHTLENLGQNSDEVIYLLQMYKQNPLALIINEKEWEFLIKLITVNKIRIINPSAITKQSQSFQDFALSNIREMLIFQEPFNNIIFQYFQFFSLTHQSSLVPQLSLKKINDLFTTNQPLLTFYALIHYSKCENKHLSLIQFGQGLTQMLGAISSYFKKGNLIISVLERYKQQQSLHNLESLFQKYIFLLENFQQLNKNQFIERMKVFFYESMQTKLDQKQFIKKCLTQTVQGSTLKKDLQVMVLYSTLFQLENQIIDHLIYKSKKNLDQNMIKTINGPNYFVKQISKMKSQCVNNGDEYCDCKKCQWFTILVKYIFSIRRNRNSAKEAQKKKREALQQIGHLQENFEKLEKRVYLKKNINQQIHSLTDENNLLKGLLSDLFQHPAIEKIVSKYAQSVELIQKDQNMQKSYLTEC